MHAFFSGPVLLGLLCWQQSVPAGQEDRRTRDGEIFLGVWDLRVDAPHGELNAELEFGFDRFGLLSATLTTSEGSVRMKDLKIRAPHLRMAIIIADLRLDLVGIVSGEGIRGKWKFEEAGLDGPWQAQRKKIPSRKAR